jgi:hypothetical protein
MWHATTVAAARASLGIAMTLRRLDKRQRNGSYAFNLASRSYLLDLIAQHIRLL